MPAGAVYADGDAVTGVEIVLNSAGEEVRRGGIGIVPRIFKVVVIVVEIIGGVIVACAGDINLRPAVLDGGAECR
mgnify:CR=1 FL=1